MPKKTTIAEPAAARPRVRRGSEADAEKLRADLVDAALALFSEQGLDAVTMRAVAQRVGVSAMTPYRYFEDKGQLLRGILRHVLDGVTVRMQAATRAQPDARGRVRAWITGFIDYWEAHPQHYRLVYMTEQTMRRHDEGDVASSPVYTTLLADSIATSRELALEIGGDPACAKLASDVRFMMLSGYLHGRLANQRYPWSDAAVLRATYVDQIVAATERCLLEGGAAKKKPAATAARPARQAAAKPRAARPAR